MADNIVSSIATSPDTTLFNAGTGQGCSEYMVSVPSGSAHGVAVYIAGLHTDNNYVVINPGQWQNFRWTSNQIKSVVAHGNGGSATNVAHGVIARDPGTIHQLPG
jgi:hypothetical protein